MCGCMCKCVRGWSQVLSSSELPLKHLRQGLSLEPVVPSEAPPASKPQGILLPPPPGCWEFGRLCLVMGSGDLNY